jgi:hypothetical protein
MRTIKLLAVDLDGTLLRPDGVITDRTRRALTLAAERHGVKIVIATGRRFHSARPIAHALGLATPLITHNGALVKNVETAAVYEYRPLDFDAARELIAFGKAFGADVIALDDPEGDGRILTDGVSERNVALRRYLEINRRYVHEVRDLAREVGDPVTQVMFCGGCEAMNALAQRLSAEMSHCARLLVTAYPKNDMAILDLMNPECSKGTGVAFVAAHFAVAREEVMAIGDNHNDVDMLHYAGRGVVMGNAEPELHALGFEVTAANTDDGVALAIERHILDEA